MRRRALLLSSLLVAIVVVAAGCAATGGQPDAPDLLASSIRATAGQKNQKVHYAVSVDLKGTPSARASAQTRAWLSKPVSLTASGGASKEAVTVSGDVAFTGRTFHAAALLGPHETFVNLLGAWYGDRTRGLADATATASRPTTARASSTSSAWS